MGTTAHRGQARRHGPPYHMKIKFFCANLKTPIKIRRSSSESYRQRWIVLTLKPSLIPSYCKSPQINYSPLSCRRTGRYAHQNIWSPPSSHVAALVWRRPRLALPSPSPAFVALDRQGSPGWPRRVAAHSPVPSLREVAARHPPARTPARRGTPSRGASGTRT